MLKTKPKPKTDILMSRLIKNLALNAGYIKAFAVLALYITIMILYARC